MPGQRLLALFAHPDDIKSRAASAMAIIDATFTQYAFELGYLPRGA